MTKDPVALRIAQPLVDRLGVDPKSGAERFSDIYLLASATSIAVDLATIDLPGIWAISILYLIGALGLRLVCRVAAANGPIILQLQPFGLVHVLMRIMLFHVLLFAIMDLYIAIQSGLAPLVPISTFRWLLDGATATVGLIALYLSICRKPPPRRRRQGRSLLPALPALPALLLLASCGEPGLQSRKHYLQAIDDSGSSAPPIVRVRLMHSYGEVGEVRCLPMDLLMEARIAETGQQMTQDSYEAAVAYLRSSRDHAFRFRRAEAWKVLNTLYMPEAVADACEMIRTGHGAYIADMTGRARSYD